MLCHVLHTFASRCNKTIFKLRCADATRNYLIVRSELDFVSNQTSGVQELTGILNIHSVVYRKLIDHQWMASKFQQTCEADRANVSDVNNFAVLAAKACSTEVHCRCYWEAQRTLGFFINEKNRLYQDQYGGTKHARRYQ